MNWSRSERRIYEEIGRRVMARRISCELTQQDIADAAGVTRANVANIEHGRQRIQVHTLLAFASALMIPPARLLPAEKKP